jgi:hypothetical protein
MKLRYLLAALATFVLAPFLFGWVLYALTYAIGGQLFVLVWLLPAPLLLVQIHPRGEVMTWRPYGELTPLLKAFRSNKGRSSLLALECFLLMRREAPHHYRAGVLDWLRQWPNQ